MRTSTDRIVTTHVGSLARPEPLLDTMADKEHGRDHDRDLFERQVTEAVRDVVAMQVDAGIDVVTDGEMGKASFFTYVRDRLDGFASEPGEPVLPDSWKVEIDAYPGYYECYLTKYERTVAPLRVMVCTGPVAYVGHGELARDVANLRAALDGHDVEEAFLPSTSPAGFGRNAYYPTDMAFKEAIAEAMREEYLAIVDAGFLLQVDDPWLVEILADPGSDHDTRQRNAHFHVDGLNHALRGIPTDRVRLHTCYGLNHGPRVHDLPLADVVEHMLRIEAGAYSFEVANPRHLHEWRVWEVVELPEDRVLLPGLVGHAQNFVEHPRLVADRIVTYANLVGRERVIASADCGFSSRASYAPEVHPEVAREKLAAIAEGAAIASKELW